MAETTISSKLEILSPPILFFVLSFVDFFCSFHNDVLGSTLCDFSYVTFIFHCILYHLYWQNPTYQVLEICSLFSASCYHHLLIQSLDVSWIIRCMVKYTFLMDILSQELQLNPETLHHSCTSWFTQTFAQISLFTYFHLP